MKFNSRRFKQIIASVAPVRERGLKSLDVISSISNRPVAPVRERGLKFRDYNLQKGQKLVAPVRERGLKSLFNLKSIVS